MKIAVHNVLQLTNDEVRQRFVVREHELDDLLAHLRDADVPRHALVIGQRGMGKSLLLRRLAVAVGDDPDLRNQWLPVLMPEELYEVTSVGELWLAALDRLAEAESDSALAEQHAALATERDPKRLATLALERLLAAGRVRRRRILLLAENVDMLLDDQIAAGDSWALREALQTEHDLLLLATAVTPFSGVESEGQAFYGFFHRLDLRSLDDTDVRALWRDLTGVDLVATRAAPIRIITGGNPRLVAVLAQFVREPTARGLRESLELLIDELTPYFKANVEALPSVERKVFITLADIWAPATTAEVAAQGRMDSNGVSSLLRRLVTRGVVRVVDGERSRKRYELCERLYNLYHLLRRPDPEGRVRALVDILVALYEPAELEREVLPRLLLREGPGTAPSAVDALVVGRLWRRLEEFDIWENMTPAELAERLPTVESILATQRETLGDRHPDTMLTLEQVALLADRAGQRDKASRSYGDLAAYLPGEEAEGDVLDRRRQAYYLGKTGDPHTALDLYRSLAADSERILGPDHPDTLTSRHQVAYYTGETGDPHTALDLYRSLAADCEGILGPDHLDTLTSRHLVAYYIGKTGDPRTALDLFRSVTADCERVLGPDHPNLLVALHEVAYYTGETGDPNTALDLYRSVAADCERVFGPDHRETLANRHEVARYIGETGDARTALDLYQSVAADCERILGRDSRDALISRHQVAYYTGETGDPNIALDLFRSVAADCERVLGPDHLDTLVSRQAVARYIGETGDPSTALDLFRSVAADCERVLGPDHPRTLVSRHGVARYTGETGDPSTALDLFRSVAADLERVLGPDHPRTLTSRYQVAYYTGETGDPQSAVELIGAVVADRERVLGSSHPDTLASRRQLADSTGRAGDVRTALRLAAELVDDAERALPNDHRVVVAARELRARLDARLTVEAGEPLPREVAEALEVAEAASHRPSS